MKKTLLFLFALLAGFSFKARATHDIGGSLTYACVAPGVYGFFYSHYNWSGLPAIPSNMNLMISSPGCSNTRVVPFYNLRPSRPGGYVPPTFGLTSYMITTMISTVVLTATEAACGNVVVNVAIGNGQRADNLSPTGGVGQYTEAIINVSGNLSGLQNSSPEFDIRNEPVLVAARYQPITLSLAAHDPDGDSLVYRLVAPITGHNQPITNYATFTGPFVNPDPQAPFSNPGYPQVALLSGSSVYSANFPLLSYYANWASAQPIIAAQKNFVLDPHSGSLSFTPMLYNTSSNNVYLVSFQIDDYRKVNGIVTKLGSIRRETIIIVGDPAGNINPKLTNIQTNIAANPANGVYTISAGTNFTLQALANDANASDSVYLASNASQEMPGANFTVSSGSQPTATFSWTPTATQVRNQPYYLRVWVKDNASPLAAKRVETFAIRVANPGGLMAVKPGVEAVNFFAFPNPFTQEVSFKLPAQTQAGEIIIYNLLGQKIDHLKIVANATNKADLRWFKAANYPAGTYLAKFVSGDKIIQTVKFIKAQ